MVQMSEGTGSFPERLRIMATLRPMDNTSNLKIRMMSSPYTGYALLSASAALGSIFVFFASLSLKNSIAT